MKAEYANPFIQAAEHVLEHELNIELENRKLNLKSSPTPGYPYAIVIGLTGYVKGQVVYAMTRKFVEEASRIMLPGKKPEVIKKLHNSVIGELANMITGKATIIMAGRHHIIEITPPSIIYGNKLNVDFLNLPTIVLDFDSILGKFEINIAFVESGSERDS